MRWLFGIYGAAALTVALSTPLKAQTPGSGFMNLCAKLSQGNMRDTTNSTSDDYKFSLFRRAILNTNFETYAELESAASTLGIDAGTLDKTFGLDASTKSDAQKFKQRIQTFKDEAFSLDRASANSRVDRSIVSTV